MARLSRTRTTVPALVAVAMVAAGCTHGDPSRAGAADAVGTAGVVGATEAGSVRAEREQCQETTKNACYTADQLRTAYGVDELADKGITGKGRTIAVVDPIGAPNAAEDLKAFSRKMGLPEPDLRIVDHRPDSGSEVPFDWSDRTMAVSALETTMDLQAAHAMAPDAQLVLHRMGAAPDDVDDQISPQALTQLVEVLAGISDDGSADVVSLSLGYPEVGDEVRGYGRLYAQISELFREMDKEGVTVVASSGDNGVYDPNASGSGAEVRTVEWPAADPNVTAVGGTRLSLDDDGRRTAPDTVWNDEVGAPGGGRSRVFAQPGYQGEGRVAELARGRRAVPDVSLTASATAGTMIYFTSDKGSRWVPVGGTSLAAPLFAGMVALAAQHRGEGLGNVNPRLYGLAPSPEAGERAGVVDITSGTNGKGGFRAGEGYDLASGLGTVDAAALVPALAGKG
ncbi:peptidase S8 [Streptomyces sp. SW4]|nr:peptidase S8 [Streptomyces sp. SW4]